MSRRRNMDAAGQPANHFRTEKEISKGRRDHDRYRRWYRRQRTDGPARVKLPDE